MLNMLNLAYPKQHADIDIPYGSRDHVAVQDTVKTMCNIDIGSRNKMRSTANNIGGTLLRKIFG